MINKVTIRPANSADAELVATFINELAQFEQLTHRSRPVIASLEKQLSETPESPRLYTYIAEVDGKPVGFTLFYLVYSTFQTKWNVHLEDLYVREDARGAGAGFALIREVGNFALAHDCEIMDLEVLRWNTKAITFYLKLGAEPDNSWTRMRWRTEKLNRFST